MKCPEGRVNCIHQDAIACHLYTDTPPTVFEKITASKEALAESIVMPLIVEYSGDVLWVSPLLQKDASKRAIFFDSKEEAIFATLKKLEEVG